MSMRQESRLTKKRDAFGWVYMIPWLIGFGLFFLYPFIHSVFLSFQKVTFVQGGGYAASFIGFKNYITAFTGDENFLPKMMESLLDLLINVPVCLVFSFFVALLLKQDFRGNFIAKVIFFLPVILGTGVFLTVQTGSVATSGMVIESAMEEGTGAMQGLQSVSIVKILQDIGVPAGMTDYITGPIDRIYSIITMSSVQIFLFLTGLKSISPSLYEAAHVEGASGWVAFWKITFPMMSSIIAVNVAYSIIDNFTMSTNVTMEYISDMAFSQFDYGLSNAMAWIYCVILTLIVCVALGAISKRVVYQS